MRNSSTLRVVFVAAFLLSVVSPRRSMVFAQGSLTPPGAPAPTFKTLAQVEPRFPISTFQTNLTVSGSYYLTTNLFSGTNNNDAINIRSNMSNITIDLNGFSIVATNPPSGASPVGIRITSATNIVIRNGKITGFDRGVRAESFFYGVVVENVRFSGMTRAGIEGNSIIFGTGLQTITIRNCIVEDINATGEAANVAADGIALVNCTGVVDSCVVRNIVAAGTGTSTCISAISATNSFINNNSLAQAGVGLRVTGGGTRVYYRDNLTAGCVTNFAISGGVDRGGND